MSMFEDVPVHGRRSDLRNSNVAAHQRNLSLDFRHVTGASGPPPGCGHQRNRSLDSVLQRIPEDMTPTSPEGAPLRLPIEVSVPRLALPPEVPAGSDDSGIHTPPDGNDEERPQPPAAARSRESLDSGNPEETEKPPDPPDDEGPVNATVEPNSVIQETVACSKKGFSFGSIRGKFFNKISSNSDDKNKVSGHSSTKNVGEVEGKRSEIKFGSGRWWKDGVNAEDQLDSPRFQNAVDNCDSISSYNISSSPSDDEPIKPNPSWSQIDEDINFQSADYCNIASNYTVHPNLADDTPGNKPTTSCSQNDEDSEECASHSTNKNSLNTIQSKPQDDKNAHDPIHTRLQDVDLSKKKDVLLRLFESKLFDMSMAISYLYNSKEPGVQSYLANKLFSFPTEEVDFYLPQLATMYIEMGDLADVLKPYLVYRCKQSAEFSLRLAWLLTAFGGDARRSRATKLRDSVLAEEIRPVARRGHHRSQSDASALRLATPTGRYLGDLASGRAFDNGCLCGEQCSCGALRLAPEIQFLTALTNIGRRLASVPDKERRKGRLRDELLQLDLNLPARVWLPLHPQPHYVLRIPPQAAAVLNSKDKAPYIMYVEVLETEGHEPLPPLPPRLLPPAPPAPHSPPIRHTKSEENLVPEWPALALYSGMDDVDAGDCWSHDDDEPPFAPRWAAPDTLSQVSAVSTSSCGSRESVVVGAGDVRRRLADATAAPPPNVFRIDPTDPSATALKESWESKLSRMRSTSPYGSLPGWKLLGCIVKVGDDLRQEMLAVQILRKLQSVWDLERVPLKLNPYEILCLDKECGLIQPVLNSVSLHQIKKQSGKPLVEWLQLEHGAATSEGFLRAQNNFVRSAAAYALTSYLLQLKDRHNGNILLDSAGHIVHIDFGFIFSTSPKNLGFESSPFKLTAEFVEVMGGESSDLFAYFKILMLRGLIAARKHCDPIIHLVELMRSSGQLPCLRSSHAVAAFRARFHHGRTDAQLQALVDRMVRDALRSLSTRLYDNYQYYTNGIL